MNRLIWGTFAKFEDSPYHSESELCGGAMTVSFSKFFPWQEMHFEISYLGAPFSWLEKPGNRMGRDVDCMADVLMGVPPTHVFQAEHRIQFRSRPMRFLGFSNHEKGVPRQEISKWSTVYSTFSRSGWSVVRSTSVAKGGTSKKRPSPRLHKVSTRSDESMNFSNDPRIKDRITAEAGVSFCHCVRCLLLSYQVQKVLCWELNPENSSRCRLPY
jgi:hypothetical protein